ncbi:hypothetical protein [Entomobacter blattae]|uniref:Uncharacterized protein n=1 Tax=Entomobacter blattae TaxID=2762277 RepID=A0A7H1NRE0_9PROT|nr:hypothetical protein [Entomobacter blattae]QNT78350.1 hypothetical protein JGUZn3_11230 [Entomobacter blattae]
MNHPTSLTSTVIKTVLLLGLFSVCVLLVRTSHTLSTTLARLPIWDMLAKGLGQTKPHQKEQLIAIGLLALCFAIALITLEIGERLFCLMKKRMTKRSPP